MAKKKAPTDWDMRSNINPSAGSQGTLFGGGTKYLSDQRWPRGYTPERQAEVAAAVVRPSVAVYTDSRGAVVSRGTQSKEFKDRKVNYGQVGGEPHLVNESRQPVRNLVDNIARSTVPAQHLGGLQWRHNAEAHLGSDDPNTTTLAHYDKRGDALSHGSPVVRLRTGQETTHTPIHEIGHHVSWNEGHEHSVYRTGMDRGREEGFADKYAFEHFRDRRGEAMTGLRMYPNPSHEDANHRLNFASGYHAVRGDIPAPDPMAKYNSPRQQAFRDRNEAEARGETLFKTWDDGEKTDFYTHPEPGASGVMSDRHIGWSRKNRP
jgi:hypothetical protein